MAMLAEHLVMRAVSSTNVPVVDLSAARTDAGRARVAIQLDEACRTSGFFAVVGHGVPDEVLADVVAESRAFFALNPEEKARCAPPAEHVFRGYLGMDATALAATLGDETPPDLSASYNIARFEEPVPDDASLARQALCWPNAWPRRPAGLRAAYQRAFEAFDALAADLLALLARSLGLQEDWFAASLPGGTSILMANYYPAVDRAPLPGQLRRGAHTDYGILTILHTEDEPGLEIRLGDAWIAVPAVPGGLIVNLGDLMAHWVGGRWVSTLHRVVVPPGRQDRDRVSVPFFFQPAFDAVVETVPSVLGERTAAPPVTAGEWIAAKSAAMMADPGTADPQSRPPHPTDAVDVP